jgi:dTDP-4-amino-4,6-dideoxygalactose transaminase
MNKLAVLGGEPVRARPWPAWPDGRADDVEAVAHVVRSGKWWSYVGEHTGKFEEEFATYHEARHGISLNSGTTALQVGLEALRVGPGDEVIVPAYTFQGTAMSVILANAVPVFADVDAETMNIDLESAAGLITDRTKAIVPVHLAGLPVDMERLREMTTPRGIAVLEDAAQAHGAVWRGKKVGALGDAGAFSFQASKNLCAGEGGIILTNDDDVAARAAALRDCGRVTGRPFYEHHLPGYNFRMTEMQSALLRCRMRQLEAETQRRWENGRRLTHKLSGLPGVTPLDPEPGDGDRRAYHLYPVRISPEELGGIARERFMEALAAEGIPCAAGYGRPLYLNPVFQNQNFRPKGCPLSCPYYSGDVDYRAVSCPTAERLCDEVIWLFHNLLLGTREDTDDIARGFGKVTGGYRELLAETR